MGTTIAIKQFALAIALMAIVAVMSLTPLESAAGTLDFVSVGNSQNLECDHCDACSKPCIKVMVCPGPCVPFGLAPDAVTEIFSKVVRARPSTFSWFSSMSARVPIPPPRF